MPETPPRPEDPNRVLVAVAWPYANGPLHLGHVAGSLLPPDIFARYHRLRGHDVAMVSGSDMHGTPITVAAEKAGMAPEAFAAKFNESHKRSLTELGIAFDLFTSTATANHREVVQDFFLTLREGGHIVERPMTAPYDPQARRFLPDRYVEGECPHCAFPDARGDQCDNCGRTLDPQELKNPRSKLSGAAPEYRETRHFFLHLPHFEQRLKDWVASNPHWRSNTVNFTQNWLNEGLKDRPITRDMTYGVPIPLEGYEDKRIYVWFEAVIGYLSATKEWAQREGAPERWRDFWLDGRARIYNFLGKDNIPFHTIIWPAMLMGYADGKGERYNLPYDVPANEFMNFQGAKFSKSRGNFITVDEALEAFHADAVRYYLSINMPEQGDTNWDWADFVSKVNDELVATVGNYVNRVITFSQSNWGGAPDADLASADLASIQPEWQAAVQAIEGDGEPRGRLHLAAESLEVCRFKEALRHVVQIARVGNQRFNDLAPWSLVKQGDEGKARAAAGVLWHLGVIKTLSLALQPFLPHLSDAVWQQLGEPGPSPRTLAEHAHVGEDAWPRRIATVAPGQRFGDIKPLVFKLDAKAILEDAKTHNAPAAAPAGTTAAPAATTQEKKTMETPKTAAAPAADADASASAFKPTITIDDFAKLDLRVGLVKSCEAHPKADKLWVLKVDLGVEERQILAGLREHVKAEDLVGKRIVVIANLAPRQIRGLESNGMVLAAEADGIVAPLTSAGDVKPGAGIK